MTNPDEFLYLGFAHSRIVYQANADMILQLMKIKGVSLEAMQANSGTSMSELVFMLNKGTPMTIGQAVHISNVLGFGWVEITTLARLQYLCNEENVPGKYTKMRNEVMELIRQGKYGLL